jgi:hypothetical protein
MRCNSDDVGWSIGPTRAGWVLVRLMRMWPSDQFRLLLCLGLTSRTRRSSSVISRLTISKNIRSMRVLVLHSPFLVLFKSRPSLISVRGAARFTNGGRICDESFQIVDFGEDGVNSAR